MDRGVGAKGDLEVAQELALMNAQINFLRLWGEMFITL